VGLCLTSLQGAEKDESPTLDIGNEKVQSITRCAAVKNIGQCTNV